MAKWYIIIGNDGHIIQNGNVPFTSLKKAKETARLMTSRTGKPFRIFKSLGEFYRLDNGYDVKYRSEK